MATIVESGAGSGPDTPTGAAADQQERLCTKGDAKVWARAAEGRSTAASAWIPAGCCSRPCSTPTRRWPRAGPLQAGSACGHREDAGHLEAVAADGQRFIRFAADRRAQGAGPATILQDLSYVGTALRHGCVAAGVSAAQPLLELASARSVLGHSGQIAKPVERDRRPTEAELQALFSHWRRHPCREIPMVDLMLFACATAMRLGEITRLDRPDLDTVGRTVLVRDRKHPTKKLGNHQRVPLLAGPFVLGGQVVDPMEIIARQQKLGTRSFPYKPEIGERGVHPGREALRHRSTCTSMTCATKAARCCSRLATKSSRWRLCSGHQDWNMLRRYTKLNPETLHRTPATTNVVPMVR